MLVIPRARCRGLATAPGLVISSLASFWRKAAMRVLLRFPSPARCPPPSSPPRKGKGSLHGGGESPCKEEGEPCSGGIEKIERMLDSEAWPDLDLKEKDKNK